MDARHACLAALLGLASGCKTLIGASDGTECRSSADCFDLETCDTQRGRCERVGTFPTAETGPPDAAEMGQPDLRVLDVSIPDAADVPTLPDARDAEVPDAPAPDVPLPPPDVPEPDMGPPAAFAPAGNCFADARTGSVTESEGALIPRARCTDRALLWSATDRDGRTSLFARTGGEPARLLDLAPGTDWILRDDTLLLVLPNERQGDALNVFRVDLALPDSTPTAIEPGPAPQGMPARGPALSAFVQAGAAEGTSVVRLHFDDGRTGDCGVRGARQWGVSVGDDFVAWFERPIAGGPTDLVVTRGLDCGARISLALPGEIAPTERLVADAGALFWMAVERETRRRIIYTASAARLADGAGPLSAQGITLLNPVEIAAHDRWLLVSSFEGARYRLHLFDLVSGLSPLLTVRGNARAPALSGTYALWAEQGGALPWEVQYEKLPRRP